MEHCPEKLFSVFAHEKLAVVNINVLCIPHPLLILIHFFESKKQHLGPLLSFEVGSILTPEIFFVKTFNENLFVTFLVIFFNCIY